MFGFLDKETARTAYLLFERAQDTERRYAGLPIKELAERVNVEFSKDMRHISHDQVTLHYEDLRDFSFALIFMLDKPLLTIQAGGPYRGIMLQHASNRWHIDLEKPISAPLGRKAKKLAEVFEKQFGVPNLRRVMAARVRR
ncbi:hypothetical protein [Caulobacter sp. LjRoot300]|uniref:hypothetical protein n=1 Tax=Caulobacter sp. LjRoot300 TaxID=3342321 RepID=UPI003ED15EF2